MASEVPPASAEQLKTLLAQYDKRLRVRLMIWGAVAATSLVVAVGVSLMAGGNRTQSASSGGIAMPDIPMAAAPLPPAELRAFKQASEAFKRATDQTASNLANVERNTAAARAETKRLANQVHKLTADSARFTGRLSSIEQQIDGITGSIRTEAKKAAADAVAKAMSTKSPDSVFDSAAPSISPPGTTPPKLSLLKPISPAKKGDALTTSAIDKMPGHGANPGTASGSARTANAEVKAADKTAAHTKADGAQHTAELKAEVGVQPKMGAIERRPHSKLTPAAEAERMATEAIANKRMAEKSMAKGEAGAAAKTAKPPTRIASVAPTRHRHVRHYRHSSRTSYGVDLGGAGSVTIAKAQWAAVKANFGPILVGMRPIAVRNHRFLTSGTFRLVAGYLRSWAAAKRICALMARQQFACQPVKFEGSKVIWQ